MNRDLFNVPAEVRPAEDVQVLTKRLNANEKKHNASALEHARQQGEILCQLREWCLRKQTPWLAWLKDNAEVSQPAASRYITIYNGWGELFQRNNLGVHEAVEYLSNLNADRRPASQPEPQPIPVEPPEPDETPAFWDDEDSDEQPDHIDYEVVKELKRKAAGDGDYERAAELRDEAAKIREQLNTQAEEPEEVERPKDAAPDHFSLDEWNDLHPDLRLPGGALAMMAEGGTTKFNQQGDNPGIQWALWSWNPVTGCLHNCPYCYARDIAERFYPTKFAPTIWPARLNAPKNTALPRDKIAGEIAKNTPEGRARAMALGNVFVCSMADLFGRWVPREWIQAVIDVCEESPDWTFLFLTKFPVRMAEFDFPENAWVGTTVDCQARVANAERSFRKVKAGVKWLSIEPLIEPLKFADLGAFQWVVMGGASRSTQTPEWVPPWRWVLDLTEEAVKLGIPYYHKPNLGINLGQFYPGDKPTALPKQAPNQLRYLPSPEVAP